MILNTLQERTRVLDLINVSSSSALPNVGFFCPPPKTDAEKFSLGYILKLLIDRIAKQTSIFERR